MSNSAVIKLGTAALLFSAGMSLKSASITGDFFSLVNCFAAVGIAYHFGLKQLTIDTETCKDE